jgi:hypothetical protein
MQRRVGVSETRRFAHLPLGSGLDVAKRGEPKWFRLFGLPGGKPHKRLLELWLRRCSLGKAMAEIEDDLKI